MTKNSAVLIITAVVFGVVVLVQFYLDGFRDKSSTSAGDQSSNSYVLAISWQPAFCETRPRNPECKNQGPDRFDGTHFSLHGLWPEPRENVYCNVGRHHRAIDEAGEWDRLPQLDLSHVVQKNLDPVMPGRQSHLDRHEWIKHGTCYPGATPDTYFSHSIALIEVLNSSPIRELFASSVGHSLRLQQIQEAFDSHFGKGAGARVRLTCAEDRNRDLIVEIRINLKGEILDPPDLSRLLLSAPPAQSSCVGGIIDPVGLQ